MQSKKMTKDNLFTHAEHQVIFRRREDLKTKEIDFTMTKWSPEQVRNCEKTAQNTVTTATSKESSCSKADQRNFLTGCHDNPRKLRPGLQRF